MPLALVGMHAHGGEYMRMTMRQRAYFGKGLERDRHAQHVSDPVVPGALENVFQAGVERFEIEVTVGIDERRHVTSCA